MSQNMMYMYYCISSHYQIAVVLLPDGNLESLMPPDEQFPSLDSFADYDTANSYSGSDPLAYITSEFAGNLFPSNGRFTIGDEAQLNDRRNLYVNGPLHHDFAFTFFLRAYPLIPNSQVFLDNLCHTCKNSSEMNYLYYN